MFTPINGHTKESIKEKLKQEFKGKAYENGTCRYLTDDGKKCAVGCFIPDGHEAQTSVSVAHRMLNKYPELRGVMPLDTCGIGSFQMHHDGLAEERTPSQHLESMLRWVDENVRDA